MTGRVIGVVGPSGAGKDSVMAGLVAARPRCVAARRVITRPTEAGGEAFEGVTPETFAARARAGAFALSWEAHGLSYGVPHASLAPRETGCDVLVNLSRSVLRDAASAFGASFLVLHVTAPADVLAARLSARGREDKDDVARRIARANRALPDGLRVAEIDNGGSLDAAVAQAMAVLDNSQHRDRALPS